MFKQLIGDKAFNHKLWQLTLPIALQSLMLAAVAAGDAIMLGQVEQNQMAAISLATQVQFVQNMALSSITSACAVLGAQYWGKGDKLTLNDLFCMILRVCGALSLVFCAACELMPRQLMMVFTHDEALIDIGASYLRIAGWSYMLTGISQCYLVIMKVSDQVKACAAISSTAVVANIALNSVFIFGLLGVPAMGSDGAAVATLLARALELGLVIFFSFKPGFIKPDLRRITHRDKLLSADFRRCMLPLLGASLFWGVGFTSYTAILGHMGADAAAANSITAVVRDLMCCACNGVSAAAGIMVGNELGAGKLELGRIYGDRLMIWSYIIGFGSTLIILALTPLVLRFVLLTPEAQQYMLSMMIIMSVYMIGRCVNTVIINGIFAAGGDTLFDMYSLAVCMWGIAIPTALLGAFVLNWPVPVVFACTCLDEVGKIPWVMAHYKKRKWVRDLTREIDHSDIA